MNRNFEEKEENPKKDLKEKNRRKRLKKQELKFPEDKWLERKRDKKDPNWMD